MLDPGTYRLLLVVVALMHMVIVPVAILVLGAFFTRRATGRLREGRPDLSLLWVAFATAMVGVPALVGGLAWNPKTAVDQITLFYLLMIVGGASAARLPGVFGGLRPGTHPVHGIGFSLLAALGDILVWACLDLLLLSGFGGGYVWLFSLIGLPAFLCRLAVHNFDAASPVGARLPLAPRGSAAGRRLPASPER